MHQPDDPPPRGLKRLDPLIPLIAAVLIIILVAAIGRTAPCDPEAVSVHTTLRDCAAQAAPRASRPGVALKRRSQPPPGDQSAGDSAPA